MKSPDCITADGAFAFQNRATLESINQYYSPVADMKSLQLELISNQ